MFVKWILAFDLICQFTSRFRHSKPCSFGLYSFYSFSGFQSVQTHLRFAFSLCGCPSSLSASGRTCCVGVSGWIREPFYRGRWHWSGAVWLWPLLECLAPRAVGLYAVCSGLHFVVCGYFVHWFSLRIGRPLYICYDPWAVHTRCIDALPRCFYSFLFIILPFCHSKLCLSFSPSFFYFHIRLGGYLVGQLSLVSSRSVIGWEHCVFCGRKLFSCPITDLKVWYSSGSSGWRNNAHFLKGGLPWG